MSQLAEDQLFWQANEQSNSIAIIVKHLWGNMLSRWTDFLSSDGEKTWRKRDEEFELDSSSADLLEDRWEEGWSCLFYALDSLSDADLEKTIYIRNQGHEVREAINRQLAHYAYHVGQIVFLGKILSSDWKSLSIPKGQSEAFNAEKFSKEKSIRHYTDEFIEEGEDEK